MSTPPATLSPDLQVSADAGAVEEVFGFIRSHWPYFLTEADYARMDSLLAIPGYVEERMAENERSFYSMGSSFTSQYLRSDPLGLFSPVLQRLEALNPATKSRVEDGFLFTGDGRTGVVLFNSPFGGSESGKNAQLVALTDTVKARTAAQFPDIRIFSSGGPEVAVGNASRIKKDSFLALAIAALLICIVLWLSYKRFADVFWILVSILTGALFALGIIACFKSSVSLIVLGIGSMIIGIAVNYPLHYVDHLKYQPDKRKALADQVNPLLVGNITTVGAFLSLLLLKAEALHDFGFIGAMMLVGTILFVLVFLPVLVPAASRPRNTVKLDFDRHIHLAPKARRWVFIGFLAVTAVLFWLSRGISFDADMHHINYMTPEQERGFALLEEMGASADGASTVYVVASGATAEEALQCNEALAPWGASGRFRPGHVPAFEAGAGEASGPLERLPGGPSRPVGPHHRRGPEGRFHGPCLPAFLRPAGRRLGGAGGGLFRADHRDAGNGDVPSGGGEGAGGQLLEDG